MIAVIIVVTAVLVLHPWGHGRAHAAETIQELHLTGSLSGFIVRPDMSRLDFVMAGASGKAGFSNTDALYGLTNDGGSGGRGSLLRFSVVPGPWGLKPSDHLRIAIGQKGEGAEGGPGTPGATSAGGAGGSATVVSDGDQVVALAGGGGGGGGAGAFHGGGNGGDGGNPGHDSPVPGGGGATGQPCSLPEASRGSSGTAASAADGPGGGGGSGCSGGRGGGRGTYGSGGGGGGGGGDFWFPYARDASRGVAPAGDGFVDIAVHVYTGDAALIASPDRATFVAGQPASFDVVTKGIPPPNLTISGDFPTGITFRVVLFEGAGQIRGTPAPGTLGTYELTVRAWNDYGSATQKLSVAVVGPG